MLTIVLAGLLATGAIWFGYPIALLLAGLVRGNHPTPVRRPAARVSVVVATRASDAEIEARVADLWRTTYPADQLEVVVALDAAARTPPPESGWASAVRVVAGDPPGGKAAALNAAVRAASGDIVVFTDVAQTFDPGTIPRLVDALLADDRLGAVSGALHLDAGSWSAASLYWRFERRVRALEARVHSTVGVTGAVYAMWRDAWPQLPPGLILDDLYLPMWLALRGKRTGFAPDAIARDPRRFSPAEEYRRKVRTLTGVVQLCAWLPAVLSPARNPVWAQFIVHKILRLLTPYVLVLVGAATVALVLTRLPWPWGPGIVAGGLLAVASGMAASRRVRELVAGVVLLQVAAIRGLGNGLRGDWNVWRT